MKISKLVENYKTFPILSPREADLDVILRALFEEPLRIASDERIDDLINLPGLCVRQVYDLGRESHWAELLFIGTEEQPLALFARHGHEDSPTVITHVIDDALATALATKLSEALTRARLNRFHIERLAAKQVTVEELGAALYFVGESMLATHDLSGYQFERLAAAPYKAYTSTESGLVKVDSLKSVYGERHADPEFVVKTAQGEAQLPAGRLVFQIFDQPEDLAIALELMGPVGTWMSSKDDAIPRANTVWVDVRPPLQWAVESFPVSFASPEDYDAFLAKYPHDTEFSGPFPFAQLPASASYVP
jgi:hypothetical protein